MKSSVWMVGYYESYRRRKRECTMQKLEYGVKNWVPLPVGIRKHYQSVLHKETSL